MITANLDTACVDANAKVKMDSAIANRDDKIIRFSKKCVNICSHEYRKMGVTSQRKYKS